MDRADHIGKQWRQLHSQYTAHWKELLADNKSSLTRDSIVEHLNQLRTDAKLGYAEWLNKGVPAIHSYEEWRSKTKAFHQDWFDDAVKKLLRVEELLAEAKRLAPAGSKLAAAGGVLRSAGGKIIIPATILFNLMFTDMSKAEVLAEAMNFLPTSVQDQKMLLDLMQSMLDEFLLNGHASIESRRQRATDAPGTKDQKCTDRLEGEL